MTGKLKKILLVDDDVDFVEVNRTILEQNGYVVRVAHSGEECLEQVRAGKPDLIVLDVMMASKNEGFNVSRDLRNSEQTKNIPVVMVTSVNSTVPFKFEPDSTWLPVNRFLDKPVSPAQLLEEVHKWLGSAQPV